MQSKIKENILAYIIALALVFNCQTIWTASPGNSVVISYLNLFLIIVGSFGIFFINRFKVKNPLIILLVFVYLIIYYFITPVNKNLFLGFAIVVCLFLSIIFCDEQKMKEILIAYSNLVFLIACISLFFWIFGTIFKVISPNSNIVSTWSNSGTYVLQKSYFNLYFETQLDGSNFLRNSAIYVESPMAGFNFSTALLVEIFLNKNINIKKVIILSIGILSTHSTTAYFILIFVGVYLLFSNKNINIRKLIWYLSILIFPLVLMIIYYMLKNKFATLSGGLRTDDYKVGFEVWKNYPLFGCGFGNDQTIQMYMDSWRSINIGFSNSITYILATGGVYLFSLYFLPFLAGILYSLKHKDIKLFCFICTFFVSWAVLIVPYNFIVVAVIMYVLSIILEAN